MTRTSLFRTITAATAVLAVSATIAACGGGGSDSTDTTRVKNNAFTTVPADGGVTTTLFDWTGGSSTTVEGSTDTTAPTDDTTAPTDSTDPSTDTTVPAETASEAVSLVQSKGQTGDAFGGAVVLSTDGSTLAVGALYADVNGNADQGSVTVFTRSGGKWAEQGVLTIAGGANDWFGYSIAMSADGSTVAVGAVYATVDGNKAQGSASVFARSGGKWALQKTLTAADGTAGDLFGYSVSLSADGSTLAVGATGSDVNGTADQGTASVFTRDGGWTLQQVLTTAKPAAKANFGSSVALSADGNTLAVGGPNAGAGAASVFTRSNGAWS